MNTNTDADDRTTAPAAALLFQAPQFVAPVAPEVLEAEPAGEQAPRPKRSRKNSQASERSGEPKKSEKDKPTVGEIGKAETERRPSKGNGKAQNPPKEAESETDRPVEEGETTKRRRRRARPSSSGSTGAGDTDPVDEVTALKGSTRLEAKRMRRREGRREGRKRQSITEAEFLARRESVDRQMVVRHKDGLDQIAVLEDGLLVEHYVARKTQQSIVGNIYLGRVQNVLPSMEAAFVDIGRGRNAVLYAGEVNWDALGMEGQPRRIEQALKSGDAVLVQVTKDPIGHKGARLTSQITLAGRYLVLVPGSSMLGISRKLPDAERARLKKILKEAVPEDTGVIVRTAAEGASEELLREDVDRLVNQWKKIKQKESSTRKAPQLLRGEPELVVRVVRDIFNEDFNTLIVQGEETWATVSDYVEDLSPDLHARLQKWTSKDDVFQAKRIDQQLAKGMDRKVWLPSGGTLVIDRTEALSVVDVNTGKFIGSGGTLEETVTRNNLEAAEEIVRQLRLRDIGGIIIIDFVDMVLESNRELVLRRLVECLSRDRTRHQVTEITSLGLVQMTRKRVGEGLVEAFSTTCEACEGRGFVVHDHPVELSISPDAGRKGEYRKKQRAAEKRPVEKEETLASHVGEEKVKTALSAIAAATKTDKADTEVPGEETSPEVPVLEVDAAPVTTKTRTPRAKKSAVVEAPVETAPPRRTRRRAATSDSAEPKSSAAPVKAAKTRAVKSLDDIALPVKETPNQPAVKAAESKGGRPRRRVASQPSKEPVAPEESARQAVQDLLKS